MPGRIYDEPAAVRVRDIRCLLAAGLTLGDVRASLPCLDGDVAAAPPSAMGRGHSASQMIRCYLALPPARLPRLRVYKEVYSGR